MKKTLTALLLALLFFFACKNEPNNSKTFTEPDSIQNKKEPTMKLTL